MPMRCALVSDIHGNEVALAAALAGIRRAGVDLVVCLGDVATLGPRPCEVVDMVREAAGLTILGNHDDFLLTPDLITTYTKATVVRDAVDWSRDQLGPDRLAWFRSFRATSCVEGVPELFLFHGSPRSHMHDLLAETPQERLEDLLRPHRAPVMAGGHTHIQLLRRLPDTLLVNPGSVGMPFRSYVGGGVPELLDYAEYAIIDIEQRQVQVTLCRAPLARRHLRQAALAVPDNPLSGFLADQFR